MNELDIDVRGDREVMAMFEGIGQQMPFALANTLNGCANETQRDTRVGLEDGRMILRRPTFVKNTIYRKPGEDFAKKTHLVAAVRVDDRPGRDFLAKFEDGGEKEGRNGHRVAIPIDPKRNKREVIPLGERPRVILNLKSRVWISNNVIRQRVGRGLRAEVRSRYLLVRSVRVPKLLGLADAALRVMQHDFIGIAGEQIDRALATAR